MKYLILAKLYEEIENNSKRIEKTKILSGFLKNIKKEDLKSVIYLLQGRVFPQWDEKKIGMSSRSLLKVIEKASGESTSKIENLWNTEGDLGLVAEKLMVNKKQNTLFSKSLSLKKVVDNISKLTEMEGEGTVNRKVGLVAELLSSASALEAKYIVRTVAETLRSGIGDSLVRDALVWTYYEGAKEIILEDKDREEYKIYAKEVQESFDVTSDFGEIAIFLNEKGRKGLEELTLKVGKPIKVMLYPKAKDIEEGFEMVGKPAMIEAKIDGFRVQIHRNKDEVKLFTRRLENVSKQFPDVIKAVKENVRSKNVILDTEVVGIDKDTKRPVPFQKISQRIRRKYDIEKVAKELPVMINVFDVIELNGENLIKFPLEERKKRLKAVVRNKENEIEILEHILCDDLKKAEKYYLDCLDKGFEGVMMKSVEGMYKPGKRVGQGVKIKPVMEPLDLVIVEAEWGEGKRAKWLSSFTVACRDGNKFLEIGKVGTGIKEKSEEGVSYEELTNQLKKLIISEKGRSVKVKKQVVLEILYEEIQASPSYSSGFALRFPRVHMLREDKGVDEISSLEEVKKFYKDQKK
ncbi:ATP-dependent DNA ligase [archaeon]|nr:ATP-dependent DNA ligase [archaeon]MBT5287558.1 ATP-dependent DNA ligase [archaeon]